MIETKNSDGRRFLGVDPGQAKIGLAVSDGETRMSFVLTTLKNDKNFWKNFSEIIQKENINAVVIGIPSYINRKEIVYQGEVLGAKIKKEFPEMEVFYQNEMFSTKIAQDHLRERGIKNAGKVDDQEAARIILESWMEKDMR